MVLGAQVVAPLLADNSRTFMLATVSPASGDFLDTCNTMRVATRCADGEVTASDGQVAASDGQVAASD
eukprot:9027218-Pyramimonas_sp.AAC.1